APTAALARKILRLKILRLRPRRQLAHPPLPRLPHPAILVPRRARAKTQAKTREGDPPARDRRRGQRRWRGDWAAGPRAGTGDSRRRWARGWRGLGAIAGREDRRAAHLRRRRG